MLLSRFELRRFRGLLPKLALIFATLVPVIYGSIYLAANWDPYGRLQDLPVAVVNEDQPVTYNKQQVHAGKDFTNNVVSGKDFDWHVTDAADAEEGLREGRYYLTVRVPKDFSANLVSASSTTPKRAEITMHRNDANGFVIGSVTGQAQNKIEQAVNETAVEAYFEAVFANLDKIRQGMIDARDGSAKLTKGLTDAKSGSAQLATGASDARNATHKLSTGANTLNEAFPKLENGAGDLQSGLGELGTGSLKLYNGASQVAGGTQQLEDTVVPVLDKAATLQGQVKQDSATINTDIQAISSDVTGTTDSVGNKLDQAEDALATVGQLPEVADTEAYKKAQTRLDEAQARNAKVATAATRASTRSAALNQRVQESDAAKDLDNASAKLKQLNSGAQQVATGANNLHKGIDQAAEGAGTLSAGITKAGGGVSQLSTGLGQLDEGMAKLDTNMTKLDEGLGKLKSGSEQLTKGLTDGVKQIPALSKSQAQGAAQVLSAPADVHTLVENPAHVYGRGLAPLFLSIAMWVFGISGFLVMRPISGRLLSGRMNPAHLTLSAYLPFGTVAAAGAFIMLATVWIALGLDPLHGIAAVGLTLLVAVVFSLIAHFLRMALGLPGSALLLVWLILQLASTGGTYPAAVLPPFFRWISPFMPISYSIDAFRVVISGGLWSHFTHDVIVLACIGVTTFLLDVLAVGARQRFTMADLHPPLQH
ncbi:YhgE/Pip domain-containing protein [Luteococcus sp. H138]|uniref:YhgE/Pip domain-containing protein n=1 Tax=unclassified Luteococcus TaxID=2639923 RepID=UPI00313D732C